MAYIPPDLLERRGFAAGLALAARGVGLFEVAALSFNAFRALSEAGADLI